MRHEIKTKEGRTPSSVLMGRPSERRTVGRNRSRWTNNISRDIRNLKLRGRNGKGWLPRPWAFEPFGVRELVS